MHWRYPFIRTIAMLSLAVLTSACAVHSVGANATGGISRVSLAQAGEGGVSNSEIRRTIAKALEEQGISVDDAAPYVLDYGVSDRPTDLDVRDGAGGEVAPAKHRPLFRACRGHIIRLTFHVSEQNSGKKIFNGALQERHCNASVATVLPRMSNALVGQLRATRLN
jgi:hypothetical protein